MRATLVVLAAVGVLVATIEPSLGVQAAQPSTRQTLASGPAADFPPSRGSTLRTAGGTESMTSGNGRWQVYTDGYTVFARDLQNPAASPQAVSIGNSTVVNGSADQLGQKTTPDGTLPNGLSTQPSISADGRYVSFLTTAMNITPVPVALEGWDVSLIVCDRDPTGARDANGEPLLDQRINGNSYPDYRCEYVYSTYHDIGSDLVAGQRPRLSADGRTIIYVHHVPSTSTPGNPFPTTYPDAAYVSRVSDGNGLTTPNPVQVGVKLPGATTTTYPGAAEAWLDSDASNAYFVSGSMVIRSSLSATLATTGSIRLDANPAEFGAGYLGDQNGDDYSSMSGLSVAQNGSVVAFVVNRTRVILQFGRHSAAAASTQPLGTYTYVEKISGSTVTGQPLSRDRAGAQVPSGAAAVSGDGRYAAFATTAANTHDGTDGTGVQIVERDLRIDADRASADPSEQRLPGALVTAATDCAPAPPAVTCGSSSSSPGADLSIDLTGYRVSFDSAAPDLVAGDSGNTADAFVRTWTPGLSDSPLSFGDVQVGTQSLANVQVAVSGFGPAKLGAPSLDPSGTTDFALEGSSCAGQVVHDGDTCDIAVRATPSSATPPTRTADVREPLVDAGTDPKVSTLTANAVTTGPVVAKADTERTSLHANSGQAPDGGHASLVSGNGRWQVFVSTDDLTGRPSSGHDNVFVRDLENPRNTVQISLHSQLGADASKPSRPVDSQGHPTGTSPNGSSTQPSISADGRFVSFLTDATDVVAQKSLGTNSDGAAVGSTVVVCDRDPLGTKDAAGNWVFDAVQTGFQVPDYACFPIETGFSSTYYFGPSPTGTRPRLSADGTKVAWVDTYRGGDNQGARVRVATVSNRGGPLRAPADSDYVYAPSDVTGFQSSGGGRDTPVLQDDPVLTSDGSAVVFTATQCCEFSTSNPAKAAIVESTLPANILDSRSTRFDANPSGGGGFLGDGISGSGDVGLPSVSDDGTRVAFQYTPDDATPHRVYVATKGSQGPSSVLASIGNNASGVGGIEPDLSGDGRYLAYVATEPNSHNGVDAVGSCSDGRFRSRVACQVVARDLVADAQRASAKVSPVASQLVSRSVKADCVPALPAGRTCAGDDNSSHPSLDATGSEIAFDSFAGDLVTDDTNVAPQPNFRQRPSVGLFSSAVDTFVSTWRPSLAVPAMDFGSVKVGASSTKTFPITLTGFGPISLGAHSVTGANKADFTVLTPSCNRTTLHEGPPAGQPAGTPTEKCTYRIRFTPAAPGVRAATLTTAVEKNSYPRHYPAGDPRSYDPAIIKNLTGFGTTAIAVVTPTSLDFGARLPTAAKTKTVKVVNTGTASLVVAGAVVHDSTHPGAHSQYVVDASGCAPAVPAGGSCIVKVTYTAARVGIQDAVLVITSNSSTGPRSIPIRARVNKPTVQSNPAVSPVRRVVTVTGTGYAPNDVVEVGFDKNGQATATTRPDGTFTLNMVVLANGPQGPRLLYASSTDHDPSITDDFPFLVVLSSTDPGVVVKRDG